MSDDHLEQVHAALVSIPGLNALDPGACVVTRLGGMTNLVFRIEVDGGPYVLRTDANQMQVVRESTASALHQRAAQSASQSRATGRAISLRCRLT